MRRFELSEGTSSKFWEIDVEGPHLTVRFGRIGSSGQTKSKELGDGTKASREADKLVSEKIAKGYIERVDATETAKSTVAKSTVAEANAKESIAEAPNEDGLVGDDEGEVSLGEAEVIGWRHAPAPYAPAQRALPAFGALLSQLRAVLPKVKAAAEDAKGKPSPAAAARMARVYAWKNVDELDVELAATAFALFRHAALGLETLVRTFVAGKGACFALEAILRGLERGMVLDLDTWPYALVDGVIPYAEVAEPKTARCLAATALHGAEPGIFALRTFAANADAATYATLVDAAHASRKSCSLASSVAIAAILSEEAEIVDDVARAILDAPEDALETGCAALIFTSLRDVELGRALIAKKRALFIEENLAWTLIARLGPRAGAVLAAVPRDEREAVLPFLRAVRTPASLRAMLPLLAKKSIATAVHRHFLAFPEAAAAACAPVLADKKHPDHRAAAAVAAAITKANPALEARLSRTHETPLLPFASASALPSFLIAPPWLDAQRIAQARRAPIRLEIDRVPLSCVVEDGDLDSLAVYVEWSRAIADENKSKSREHWKKVAAAARKNDDGVDLALMLVGPEDLALAEWNAAGDRRLYYPNTYYAGAFVAAIARRGTKFVPGLVKLLEASPGGADRMPIELLEPVLLACDGTELAELVIADFDSGKKFRETARRWCLRHASTAAKTAIPHALAAGKTAANAVAILRALVAHGHADVVGQVAAAYERTSKKAVQKDLEAVLGADPMMYFPEKLPKLPEIFNPKALPPIVTRQGGALPPEATLHVGTMLAISRPDSPYAGLALLRDACTRESLREFSWALFEAWMATGSPPKDMWILHALGFLGDDETARRLTPMIRAWPGERAAARAVEGLGVLENLGSDLALMLLLGIADNVRFASIQEGARERIRSIAQKRGLTAEELGDRLVPDVGLDASGETTLDFGPRVFRVGFDEHLSPFILDPDGKKLAALPKPAKTDVSAKASEASARFKALKKDVAAIAKSRIERLEGAMIARRRWDEASFRAFFVDKPLVLHLTRRLVWAAYDASGERLATFRVDADKSLANDHDEAFTFPAGATVGVVHPLDLDRAKGELARWSTIFADYELLQPFAQIGRETFGPSEKEKKATSLLGQEGRELRAPALVFGLEKRGWKRWAASDGGSFSGHTKTFDGTPFVAHVEYDGVVGMGYIEANETLALSRISFDRGNTSGVPIGEVDRVIVSEVLRDLSLLDA